MNTPKPPIVKSNVTFFIVINILGLIVAPLYGLIFGFSAAAWILFAVLLVGSGMAITAGYHRLWSHRTYSAAWPLRAALAFFGFFSIQNSILVWAARHRVHHRHVDDEDKDPHSIKTGFWHAHMGWMVRDWPTSEVDFDQVRDLKRDPIVMWQHRNYWTMTWLLNLGLPVVAGLIFGDLLGMFCWPAPSVWPFPSTARFSSIHWPIPGASAATVTKTLPVTTASSPC